MRQTYCSIGTVLPLEIGNALSSSGRRIYMHVCNRLSRDGRNSLLIRNKNAARDAHVTKTQLLIAQDELVRFGLLRIHNLSPMDQQTDPLMRYVLLELQ